VAIQGNNVVVGGWGSAYLFNALTGQQVAKLVPTSVTREYGISVALNDDVVLVGSNTDNSLGEFTGAAYVFDINTHTQIRKIVPNDALGGIQPSMQGDNFGLNVALDGNNAIIGSLLHSQQNGNAGAAYVFDVRTGMQLAELSPPPRQISAPAFFGSDVDIRGNLAVIGAPYDQYGTGTAYLYDWTTGKLLDELVADNFQRDYHIGYSVALGNGFALVGAPGPETLPAWNSNLSGGPGTLLGNVFRFELPVVPEPSSLLLALLAAVSIIVMRRA
jgi:hypothetical protein